MKTALIQLKSTNDKAKNIARAVSLVKTAIRNRARFILLPETFNYRGVFDKRHPLAEIAEPIPGESLKPFLLLAKTHKVYILAGSLYEKIKGSKKVYNTSVLIDAKGKVAARYRKMNLFDAVINKKVLKESKHFAKGRQPKAARVGGFGLGMSICYDLRFPELYRQYKKRKVHLLAVPSSFTYQTGKAHWELLLRARAVENLCYVLAPNQTGVDTKGVRAYGNSMIISPWGEILACASTNKEGIVFADLKLSSLKKSRKILPAV